MANIIVKVTNADYYDTVTVFVDGTAYGKQKGNSTFEIAVADGPHTIHAVYDNMEPDFAGISHTLGPVAFSASGTVQFEVKISNIYAGGKFVQL